VTYRILSLDGGGTWALIQVRALMSVLGPDMTGHEVLSHFDLAAANSGGAIVLGGLVEDLPLAEVLNLIEGPVARNAIFSPTSSLEDQIARAIVGVGPKYSAAAKLTALTRLLPNQGAKTLPAAAADIPGYGGDPVRLLITAFDYDRNRGRFFRSAASGGPAWGQGAPTTASVVEAIHASTDAPVAFFDAPAAFPVTPGRFWDGGVAGCNNPVLAAVAEALAVGVDPKTMAALAIGTGSVALPWLPAGAPPEPWFQTPSDTGLINDIRKLAGAITDDPPDIATWLAHLMTGAGAGVALPDKSRIVRMNPLVSPLQDANGDWGPPTGWSTSQFSALAALGMDAIAQSDVDLIEAFTAGWLAGDVSNQPIRMNGDTLALELGQATFAQALDAWNRIH
jgi:hypothetical protein